MHVHGVAGWRHDHRFGTDIKSAGERRTLVVVILTAVTMAVEIAVGWFSHSMALLADGWHMATHAGALGIALFAYAFARRHARNPTFTFGTGKVGVLGGYTSAVVLGIVALLMVWESGSRFFQPLDIAFGEAIAVAIAGLVVNLASAWLLRDDPHPHGHDLAHDHDHGHHHAHVHDHNLHAAYMHVLADALTSILAIAALLAGRYGGWVWMDPLMGVVGAVVIGRWSWGLIAETGQVLLDGEPTAAKEEALRAAIEADSDNRIADLHLWRVGPEQHAAIVSVVTHDPRPPQHYKDLLSAIPGLAHVTVEVNPCTAEDCA